MSEPRSKIEGKNARRMETEVYRIPVFAHSDSFERLSKTTSVSKIADDLAAKTVARPINDIHIYLSQASTEELIAAIKHKSTVEDLDSSELARKILGEKPDLKHVKNTLSLEQILEIARVKMFENDTPLEKGADLLTDGRILELLTECKSLDDLLEMVRVKMFREKLDPVTTADTLLDGQLLRQVADKLSIEELLELVRVKMFDENIPTKSVVGKLETKPRRILSRILRKLRNR